MPKSGVLSVAAHNHPHVGKKPLQRNASLWFCLFLIVSMVFVSACVSERGRPGPAGANGTPGATGPAGAGNMTAGPAGPPGPAPDLTDYYLNDTSKALTGQNLFRNLNTENLNLFGGTTTAGKGGIVSVQGKDLAANDAIVFYVPDMTYVANLIAAKFIGGVGQPYLDMQTRQIKSLGDPTANQDAATKKYVDDINATGVTDHGALTGLADDDHPNDAHLPGRPGGQSLTCGTGSGDDCYINSTSHATKGSVVIQPNGGNVIIGNTSGVGELAIMDIDAVRVNITSDTSTAGLYLGGSVATSATSGILTFYNRGYSTASIAGNTRSSIDSGVLIFSTRPSGGTVTVRMRIQDDGNVSIATSQSLATLQVNGTLRFPSVAGGTLTTDAVGNVYVVSDVQLKRDIRTYSGGLQKILSIPSSAVITYKFKPESGLDTVNDYTFVDAAQLRTAIPEAVYEHGVTKPVQILKTKGIEGQTEDEYEQIEVPVLDEKGVQKTELTVDVKPIIATELNAIKELNQKIEVQNATINNQQAQINNLTARIVKLEKKVGL